MVRVHHSCAILLLLASLACGEPDAGPDVPPASPDEAQPPVEARPDTRSDTLLLEGMPQPVSLQLVRAPEDVPAPFTTYATSDFEVESDQPGDQRTLRLVAAFGGQRNDDAFIEIASYPSGVEEAEAIERARRTAGDSVRAVSDSARAHTWTTREWRTTLAGERGSLVRQVLLGRRGDAWFHVLVQHPPEYGDGFGPRVHVLLEEWRWSDGTPLMR